MITGLSLGLFSLLACFRIQHAPVFRSRSLIINSTEDSTLSCYHPSADFIGWRVELMNGTVVERGSDRDIVYHNCRHSASDPLRYTVTIPSKPEYDGAHVICHAIFQTDVPPESLPILTLTTSSRRTMNVSVGEVADFQCASCSRIDWLVNSTHLNNLPVASNDITVTSIQALDRSIQISTLFIIGRRVYNNTSIGCRAEGALERLPAVSLFVYQRQCQENFTLNSNLIINSNKQVEVLLTAHNMNLNSSDRIYIVQLDSLDGLTSSRLEVVPSYHDQALVLMFTLPRGRIWNCTFIAFCEFTFELSTHDIQNISVGSRSPGQVTIALDFLQGSTATDILTMLYRRSDSHVLYDLVPRLPNIRNTVVNVTGVDSGAYYVFVYAVEGNGTYSLATVEPQSITVDSSDKPPPSELPPPKIEYDTQMTFNGFKVTCNFLDSSISQCVVVVHQKFPVPDNHLIVTLYVHRLGSVGNVVSGYIDVANPDDFQIAVIDGTRKPTKPTKPTSNTPHWIIGLVVGGFLLLVLCLARAIIAGFACMHIKRMKRQAAPESGSQPLPAREGSLQSSSASEDGSPQPLLAPESGLQPLPGGSPQPSQHVETEISLRSSEESPHDDVSPESDEGQTFISEQGTRKNVTHRKDDRKLSVKRHDIALGEKDSGDNSIASTETIRPLLKQMESSTSNLVAMDIQFEQDTKL